MTRLLTFAGVVSGAVVIATLAAFLAFEKRQAAAAPDYGAATVGGIAYQAVDSRPLHPRNAVDRRLIAGLPARDRRLRRGELLFGAFIGLSNTSAQPRRSADLIELRHDAGRIDRPLALPASNPYAYSPRVLGPHASIPSPDSPAGENLAAEGHDPHDPSRTVSIIV